MLFFCQKTAAHSRPCGWWYCCGEGTNHHCSTFLVIFSVCYCIIFSQPSNKTVDSQFVQEEQIVCAQFHQHKKKLINMILSSDRTCQAFFAFGELASFPLAQCLFCFWVVIIALNLISGQNFRKNLLVISNLFP